MATTYLRAGETIIYVCKSLTGNGRPQFRHRLVAVFVNQQHAALRDFQQELEESKGKTRSSLWDGEEEMRS